MSVVLFGIDVAWSGLPLWFAFVEQQLECPKNRYPGDFDYEDAKIYFSKAFQESDAEWCLCAIFFYNVDVAANLRA